MENFLPAVPFIIYFLIGFLIAQVKDRKYGLTEIEYQGYVLFWIPEIFRNRR